MSSLQERRSNCLVPLTVIKDARGTLVAAENGPELPFSIERLFFVVGANATRGFHAHHKLHELLVCAAGSCRVTTDDGTTRDEYVLDRPDQGFHLKPLTWIELDDFSNDCVLVVLASAAFEEADYIRDYDAFLAAVRAAAQP